MTAAWLSARLAACLASCSVPGWYGALARWLVDQQPGALKVFVDTAPVMEKPLAQGAGLGWQGKHSNLVSRDHGSWLFLGAIYTEGDDFIDQSVDHSDGDFDAEIADFAAAIRGAQRPDVAPEDALEFMKLLDAIYLSAESGGKVWVAR